MTFEPRHERGLLVCPICRRLLPRHGVATARVTGWREDVRFELSTALDHVLRCARERAVSMDSEMACAIDEAMLGLEHELAQWPDGWIAHPHGSDENPHVWFRVDERIERCPCGRQMTVIAWPESIENAQWMDIIPVRIPDNDDLA